MPINKHNKFWKLTSNAKWLGKIQIYLFILQSIEMSVSMFCIQNIKFELNQVFCAIMDVGSWN